MEDNHENNNIDQKPLNNFPANCKQGRDPKAVEISDEEFQQLAKEELKHQLDETSNVDCESGIKPRIRTVLKLAFAFFVCMLIWSIIDYPRVIHESPDRRLHACFGCQRVILGVIETYNMDNSELMTELNEKNLQILVDKKYFKQLPEYPTKDCKYECYGLDGNEGHIYCVYHGEPGTQLIKGQPSPYLAQKNAGKNMTQITAIAVSALILFIAIWAFR